MVHSICFHFNKRIKWTIPKGFSWRGQREPLVPYSGLFRSLFSSTSTNSSGSRRTIRAKPNLSLCTFSRVVSPQGESGEKQREGEWKHRGRGREKEGATHTQSLYLTECVCLLTLYIGCLLLPTRPALTLSLSPCLFSTLRRGPGASCLKTPEAVLA